MHRSFLPSTERPSSDGRSYPPNRTSTDPARSGVHGHRSTVRSPGRDPRSAGFRPDGVSINTLVRGGAPLALACAVPQKAHIPAQRRDVQHWHFRGLHDHPSVAGYRRPLANRRALYRRASAATPHSPLALPLRIGSLFPRCSASLDVASLHDLSQPRTVSRVSTPTPYKSTWK